MSYTNETKKLKLPQWVGTDRPTYLVDFNTAFLNIDNAFIANDTDISSIRSKLNSFISTMLDNTKDLNNIENGNFSLEENNDFVKQNRPNKRKSYLKSYSDNVGTWQILITDENYLYIRSKMNGDTWSSWSRLISESELKEYMKNIDTNINSVDEKIDSYIDDSKLLQITYCIDEDKTDWDNNIKGMIKAKSGKVITLKPSDNFDISKIPNFKDYRPIGTNFSLAIYTSFLTLHGFDFRYYNNEHHSTISVRNNTDDFFNANLLFSKNIAEVTYCKKDYIKKMTDFK